MGLSLLASEQPWAVLVRENRVDLARGGDLRCQHRRRQMLVALEVEHETEKDDTEPPCQEKDGIVYEDDHGLKMLLAEQVVLTERIVLAEQVVLAEQTLLAEEVQSQWTAK